MIRLKSGASWSIQGMGERPESVPAIKVRMACPFSYRRSDVAMVTPPNWLKPPFGQFQP